MSVRITREGPSRVIRRSLGHDEGIGRIEPTPAELYAVASAMPAEHRLAVWLGAVLGLRWSEIAGLRVGRLDLEGGRPTIAEAVTRGPHGVPALGRPK